MVDFTDFYPTLAEAAGVKPGAGDPIDGHSIFARLCGKPGQARDWVLCHYQPYWNMTPGQFVRTQQYKLYRDGRFYSVPEDLQEKNDLGKQTGLSPEAVAARSFLKAAIAACPPAPKKRKLGKNTPKAQRPVYPDWPRLNN